LTEKKKKIKKKKKKKKKNTNTNHYSPERARGKTITAGSTKGNKNYTTLMAGRCLTSTNSTREGQKRHPPGGGRRGNLPPPKQRQTEGSLSLSLSLSLSTYRKLEPLSLMRYNTVVLSCSLSIVFVI